MHRKLSGFKMRDTADFTHRCLVLIKPLQWNLQISKMESINCSATQTECAGQDSGLPTGITFPAMEFQMVYH
ncbi:unnamed protein product [Lathyrus oleraceus]